MATIKDIRFVLAELNISKGTSRYNKQQLLEVLNDEFYNNNDLVTSCSLPNVVADVTTTQPIAAVHFTFDDGLCLGHGTSTLFDTYVMHNQAQPLVTDAQPSEQHDSELTRESFNEARELYPTRIANNYLHYICLVLAYVYATIYIGCQVTHSLVTVIVQYIIAKRLTSIITATLHDMSFKPFYLDSWHKRKHEVTKCLTAHPQASSQCKQMCYTLDITHHIWHSEYS